MPVERGELEKLRQFFDTHDLMKGCLALDLDGTALTEHQGRIFISPAMEQGIRAMHELKRPIIINTLRFPLSVIHTIGNAWYELADIPVPTVLLNGSILGHIQKVGQRLEYEEITAYPMTTHEIKLVLDGVNELLAKGIDEILLFYYPRDWRLGESLWTPKPERVDTLKEKFVSACKVISCPVDQLTEELHSQDMCMMSLFIDRPQDTLMAYQHSKRNSFFTRKGVDKAYGLTEMAKHFQVSLDHSIGAGDTEMDSFLSEVGLAVIVGGAPLRFRGKSDTVRVSNPSDLGELLTATAETVARKPVAA
jgi:hydroxymethylpyrimidine pyrophosphatase-like HAD family hydrolase